MNKENYEVLRPVHLDGLGTLMPGDSVELYPRQAVFLVTSGMIKAVKQTETAS